MDNLLNDMGQRLSKRRKQLGLTQEQLAEKAKTTTQTISTAETGRKALRPENILKLCDALDISIDYLFRGVVSSCSAAAGISCGRQVGSLEETSCRGGIGCV